MIRLRLTADKVFMQSPSPKIPILTVTQLTNAIKRCLETSFSLVWIQGEISNLKQQSSGHLYFSLKDAQAQIAAVMFKNEASALAKLPKDGNQVIVYGELSLYPPSGRYQIVIRELRFVGLGELLLKLEELKVKLHKKGWFHSSHKKPLPKFPKKIGVVTSPTGAVIQDILTVLSRRYSGFHLILNPVKVQGEGAAQEIAKAIEQFNRYDLVDVMIVGRGGGSIEDLWAFNEEIVAEAIFNSRIPIISAVGHETDHCIADYVADLRAPTPSAAAEIVVSEKAQLLHFLEQSRRRLYQAIYHVIRLHRHRLKALSDQPFFRSPYAILSFWMQKMDDLRQQLDQNIGHTIRQRKQLLAALKNHLNALQPINQIRQTRQKLAYWEHAIHASFQNKIEVIKKEIQRKEHVLNLLIQRNLKFSHERLSHLRNSLQSLDPKNVLNRGYSILFAEKDHSVITSVHTIKKDEDLRIVLSDGQVLTTIKDIVPK